MNDLSGLGKILAVAGALMALTGVLLMAAGKVPWLGRLPGDIYIKRERFSFYFPVATSILLSVVLSLVFYLLGRK